MNSSDLAPNYDFNAHLARLTARVQSAIVEGDSPDFSACLSNRFNFGVRCRIRRYNHSILSDSKNLGATHHDSAERVITKSYAHAGQHQYVTGDLIMIHND